MVYSIFTRGYEGTWHTISSKDQELEELLLVLYLRIKGIITLDGIIHDNKIEWKREEDNNNTNHGAFYPFGVGGAVVGLEGIRAKLPDWVRIEAIRTNDCFADSSPFFFYKDSDKESSEDNIRILSVRLEDEYRVPIRREYIKEEDPENSDKIIPRRGTKYRLWLDRCHELPVDGSFFNTSVDNLSPAPCVDTDIFMSDVTVPLLSGSGLKVEYIRISINTEEVLREISRIIEEGREE